MRFALPLALAACFLGQLCSAQNAPSTVVFSVPPADAPELAHRGAYGVGVRTVDIKHRDQVDILQFDKATGKAPSYDRPLRLEVWYPATIPPGAEQKVMYPGKLSGDGPQSPAKPFENTGMALRDATPLPGGKFPLVVVSHGYPGSRFFLSYLTENLASKGYVVVAIDHTDSVSGEVRPFPSTLLNRSADQLFTIESIDRLSHTADSFLNGIVDISRTAIVGYSMGGYGALISAGAAISKSSPLVQFVPGGYLDPWTVSGAAMSSPVRNNIKAIVAIAPWGEQEPYQTWTADSLAAIRVPSLFIVGDHDDVAGFEDGPKRAFNRAANSDRCLLVYENARHNTGGNPPPSGITLDYRGLQSFDEPVWRKDRITAINQHFITAFLDLNLKGDQSRRAYLHVPIAHSNEGKWATKPNAPDEGTFSSGKDEQGNAFWPGFERRAALGLEMYCLNPGQQVQ